MSQVKFTVSNKVQEIIDFYVDKVNSEKDNLDSHGLQEYANALESLVKLRSRLITLETVFPSIEAEENVHMVADAKMMDTIINKEKN